MGTYKRDTYKIIENEFIEIIDKLQIVAPNTGNVLVFDTDGWFLVSDAYGKTLKKYKTLEKAIDYMLENN